MRKIILLSVLLTSVIFLGACTNPIKQTQNKKTVEEEKNEEIAGGTEEEQDKYIEGVDEVSEDDSLRTLEKELDETVVLDEDFSDL